MARSKHFRRSHKMQFPIAVVAGFVPEVAGIYARRNSVHDMGDFATTSMTGFSLNQPGWYPQYLKNGLLPIIGGLLIHKVASAIGINRMLSRARIPLIRV